MRGFSRKNGAGRHAQQLTNKLDSRGWNYFVSGEL